MNFASEGFGVKLCQSVIDGFAMRSETNHSE